MQKLVCEMCGSKDLIKQDGLYVCQWCGVKYTLEEAKKLMTPTTVKIDSSETNNNYSELAENSLENENWGELKKYCNKMLEINSKNPRAWLLKGKAIIEYELNSDNAVDYVKFKEGLNCLDKATENASNEEKEQYKIVVQKELEKLDYNILKLKGYDFYNTVFEKHKNIEKTQLEDYKDFCNKIVKKFEENPEVYGHPRAHTILKEMLSNSDSIISNAKVRYEKSEELSKNEIDDIKQQMQYGKDIINISIKFINLIDANAFYSFLSNYSGEQEKSNAYIDSYKTIIEADIYLIKHNLLDDNEKEINANEIDLYVGKIQEVEPDYFAYPLGRALQRNINESLGRGQENMEDNGLSGIFKKFFS